MEINKGRIILIDGLSHSKESDKLYKEYQKEYGKFGNENIKIEMNRIQGLMNSQDL